MAVSKVASPSGHSTPANPFMSTMTASGFRMTGEPVSWMFVSSVFTATLYYAASCDQCSEVGSWFERRNPIGLRLLPAESFPGELPTRITYVAADGTVFTGIGAVSRSLDHVNLAWAWLGWLVRLPGACEVLQVILDGVGGGPRAIQRNRTAKTIARLAPNDAE